MVKIDNKKTEHTITIKENDSSEFSIYGFSKSVIKQLSKESVPSVPVNYKIFFEKMLENETDENRKKICEIMEAEDEISKIEDDRKINIEREVKNSFLQIKNMLQAISLIYKNLGIMKTIVKKRIDSLGANSNLLTVQNVLNAFNDDLDRLNALVAKHLDVIKMNYEDVSRVFRLVEEQSIYDTKFDLYNKKYLLKTLENELTYVKQYGYNSSLMFIKPKSSFMEKLGAMDAQVLLRNISKLLLRTSRRSDVLAHYGSGCFAMLMKHTDLEAAKKACERIVNMLYSTTFVIGGGEIDIDMEIVACGLSTKNTIEEMISSMLDTLPKTGRQEPKYIVLEDK